MALPPDEYRLAKLRADERVPERDLKLVLDEALQIVTHRGATEGRNLARDFWDTFPHGLSDMTFMLRDKTDRIMGAEKMNQVPGADCSGLIRETALDIINYAGFIVMWLDIEAKVPDVED